ncbi:MAG TPA: bifunctional riboflavin kinase/FAD synthetase [Thermoleophilia bacterium]|nr:bifunctional riboflavin kinase/FAD synthetase [Thermoleophilia bacterium]
MQVVRALGSLSPQPRAVAIGTFDGVHVGHRAVIGEAVARARARGLTSAVLTFDRHPLAVLDAAHQPRLLTTAAEKERLIAALGPDELVVVPFDEELAELSPAAFCRRVLRDALDARIVVVGENFTFGAGGRGDAAELARCGEAYGFESVTVSLLTGNGRPISSTRIRRLLREGRLEEVRAILGRPPSASGRVVPGMCRGRTLGMPTANVDVEAGTVFPGRGVYAARACVAGRWFRAAVNVGHNPTFHDRGEETTHVTVEAHLLGFKGDIYDEDIRLDFLHKLRDERRFATVAALVAQMQADIAATAALDDPALDEVGLGRG